MKKGTLYLIPTTLGDTDDLEKVLPAYNREIVGQLDEFIVEQLRTARRFLRKMGHPLPIDEMKFYELNKHTADLEINAYLNPLLSGKSMGLLSEAGTPCVADPGSAIVQMAHEQGIEVVPLTGPNSIILALMASGFNGQNFVFHGYLPVDKQALIKKIREMETASRNLHQTQIFIETPYRNRQLFDKLVETCRHDTKLCVATDLTLEKEKIKTKTVAAWKKETVDLHKKPTVFLLYF
ncbi:MAG: SAM-dependent methyltransferase [Bacteroidetes bacterium]|nr:MAG: SAM-dependent methyltransferase [Bacteroidota bacterium]RLD74065.1 MAG: SAM-dependent methyltransferase [Bacteroidota bacterium]RLD88563.1 MAG: SAM-dependent methyltransferase [Bacteroidota bacterium]